MGAGVPPRGGDQLGRDLDAREGPPLAQQPIPQKDKLVAVPPYKGPAVYDKGQHAVGRGLLQLHIAAAGRKTEPRAVDELAVLFGKLAVVALFIICRGIGVQLAVRQALQQQVGAWLGDHAGTGQFLRQGGCLAGPERMIVGQSEQQKDLEAPVRAAGGVVLLGHVHLRVAVADRQHTVPVKDGPGQPPRQIADDDALHDGQGQRLQPRPDAGGVERALPDAVAEAAAKGQRRAVRVKPLGELPAELHGALTVERCAGGVAPGGKHAVQHRVILYGPRVIVVLLRLDFGRPVGVPAVPDIPLVHLGHVGGGLLHTAGHTHGIQRQIDQHPEEQPVAAGQVVMIDRVEPLAQLCLFGVRQRVPDTLGCLQYSAGQRRHLDKKLVVIVGVAPVFGAVWVGAVDKPPLVDRQERIGPAAARPERCQRPQRAGESLHPDGALRVGGAGIAQMQQRPARGIERQKGAEKPHCKGGEVLFCL